MTPPTIFGDARNLIPLFVFIAVVLAAFIAVLVRGTRARACPSCGQRRLAVVAQRRTPALEIRFQCRCGARFIQIDGGPLVSSRSDTHSSPR